jgi:hypothetical protein
MADIKNRIELIREFESAPSSTLFSQSYIAALRDCSLANIERERWQGKGVPFLKIGHRVLYRKSDYLAWLERHQSVRTTSEARAQAMQLREVLNVAVAASRGEG